VTEARPEQREGITGPPRDESELRAGSLNVSAPRRPGSAAILAGIVALVVLAIIAAVAAGAAYAIPFAVIAVLLLIFALASRGLARHSSGPGEGHSGDDSEDPVPHVGFDQDSSLGANPDQTTEDAHDDPGRSTGGA
jgi:hypothetical protein